MKNKLTLVLLLLLAATASYAREYTATPVYDTIPSGRLADRIVDEAMKYIGTPYAFGARGPKRFDCSGFTRYIYDIFGYKLGRSSTEQAKEGREVAGSISDLQKGDIVVFCGRRSSKRPGHVGIFIGMEDNGTSFTFIHASTRRGVIVSQYSEDYYRSRFLGARRFIPDFTAETAAPDREAYEDMIEHSAVTVKDTLTGASLVGRVAILSDGTWAYVGEDGSLSAPSQEESILLSGNGGWKKTLRSYVTVPRLGGPEPADTLSTKPVSVQDPATKVDTTSEPAQSVAPSDIPAVEDGPVYHVIKKGDTLYGIARKNHTSVKALCELNGMTPKTKLKIGKKIRIK